MFINSRKTTGLEFLSSEEERTKLVCSLGNRMKNLGVSGSISLVQTIVVQFHYSGTQAVSSVGQE